MFNNLARQIPASDGLQTTDDVMMLQSIVGYSGNAPASPGLLGACCSTCLSVRFLFTAHMSVDDIELPNAAYCTTVSK